MPCDLLFQVEKHRNLEHQKKAIVEKIKCIAANMSNDEVKSFFIQIRDSRPRMDLIDSCIHMLKEDECLSQLFDSLNANENIEPEMQKIVQFVRREYYAARAHGG